MNMKAPLIVCAILLLASVAVFGSGASEERYFSSMGIDSVSVNAQFLDVQVKGNDGFTVTMTADLRQDSLFGSRSYRVLHEQVGSRLNVWIERDYSFFGGARGGAIVLEVPRQTLLKLESISGSISIQGTQSRGLSAKTVSGSIRLQNMQGSVEASSVSGSIQGTGVSIWEDSSFSSVSGSVDVRLDTPLDDFRFDLSTVSGRIVVGTVRAEKGLRMGFGGTLIRGKSVSGSLIFR